MNVLVLPVTIHGVRVFQKIKIIKNTTRVYNKHTLFFEIDI